MVADEAGPHREPTPGGGPLGDGPPGNDSPGDGSLGDTVLVSNRGPLSFQLQDGRPVPTATAGGLAGSLRPLVVGTGATWVASALSEADRAAAGAGLMVDDGVRIELVEPDPDVYAMAYDVVSNASLWFCHHHLFDGARRPRSDRRWEEAWEAYRAFNLQFAERVAKVAPDGGRVLVQDYHLVLVGAQLAALRPDLRTVHFTHTPFADPAALRMLPTAAATELLHALGTYGACGFHTDRWADSYRADQRELGVGAPARDDQLVYSSPLSPDPEVLAASAARPEVAAAGSRVEEAVGDGDRQVIVRVDRMELSKNLLRGFWAFDELLERRPDLRGRVVFLALTYPSRQGLPEYLAYQNEVATVVERINARWAEPGWTPVALEVEDDYPLSLAALKRYDVLLVNPVRDGLNLVAKEGPLINTRSGVLVLSREAGAFAELAPGAVEVNPFDVSGTALALGQALDMDAEERGTRADVIRSAVLARSPAGWLADQRAAAR